MTQVRGTFESIETTCNAQVQDSTSRQEAQAVSVKELETTRQLNVERTAGLEASLAHLVSQETEAHQSYESSVQQRGTALEKHLSTNKATVDQANAIGSVLNMMKQK